MPKKATDTKAPVKKTAVKAVKNPLFEKRSRNFGIGQAIQPRRDMTRFVRWPRYIQLQRQRVILMNRLKVPPTINQFTRTADKTSATQLFRLLNKYKPETKLAKKQRLMKLAEAKSKGDTTGPVFKKNNLIYGLSEITTSVEQKKAKLVVIAHDVDPIELVVWLPTLCRKMGVPYVIVKGKSRLGAIVHQKTVSAVAFEGTEKEDAKDLASLTDLFMQSFNNNTDLRKIWGGGKLGGKAVAAQKKRERAVAKEKAAKQEN